MSYWDTLREEQLRDVDPANDGSVHPVAVELPRSEVTLIVLAMRYLQKHERPAPAGVVAASDSLMQRLLDGVEHEETGRELGEALLGN